MPQSLNQDDYRLKNPTVEEVGFYSSVVAILIRIKIRAIDKHYTMCFDHYFVFSKGGLTYERERKMVCLSSH